MKIVNISFQNRRQVERYLPRSDAERTRNKTSHVRFGLLTQMLLFKLAKKEMVTIEIDVHRKFLNSFVYFKLNSNSKISTD